MIPVVLRKLWFGLLPVCRGRDIQIKEQTNAMMVHSVDKLTDTIDTALLVIQLISVTL